MSQFEITLLAVLHLLDRPGEFLGKRDRHQDQAIRSHWSAAQGVFRLIPGEWRGLGRGRFCQRKPGFQERPSCGRIEARLGVALLDSHRESALQSNLMTLEFAYHRRESMSGETSLGIAGGSNR